MRLYVGNLPVNTDNEQLRELFARCGQVISAEVVVDKYSGRSRGFGFVEMETEDGGRAAISELHSLHMGGRKLTVSPARPPRSFGGGSKG